MTIITKIRRQGGAAVVTIPPAILKTMELQVGDQLSLEMHDGELVVKPIRKTQRRYKLSELLEGGEVVSSLNADMAWVMEGDPVGHEIS
ncbi:MULTISPECIES: AbrB/MazE/SpoVT family DNA-binding domain-containing protein [Rhizobium]|jgi:antitoxin ChpS|uniref:Antitoxin ChpS n=1 Tax=Rhizobium soli TaxID=424798 RepID=A0A7X0JLQ1_9HYPH|nr:MULTISPECIES: AbrB/MazE/SpoVT family DNA-binding domain-containing protein [Rhizobium]MBB6509007.1 antitoxin ChpS [Rhizobium soli]MBD8649749.1 PbsX family transcriptional regulator [Rhizobium sp. CFBP 13726]SEH23976.1 antitoxin ChpS [Rhizobium sp. NFR12]